MKNIILFVVVLCIVLPSQAQNLGVKITTPLTDIHLKTTSRDENGSGGITIEEPDDAGQLEITRWKLYHSGVHLSFAEQDVRRAYIEGGTGDYIQPSDARLKQDIEPLGDVLSNVLKLKPALYHYKSASVKQTKTLGFLAQEVQTVFPDIVHTSEDGKFALSYKDFGILAIKAVQEQQEIINDLTQTIKALSARIDELEKK